MPDCISSSVGSGHADGKLGEPGSSAIDLSHLERYTFGDLDLQREVLGLFADQLTASLDDLRTAETAAAWRRAAHTLKGSASAVGATALAAVMQDAENLPDADDPGSRRAALTRIATEASAVVAFLSSGALI